MSNFFIGLTQLNLVGAVSNRPIEPGRRGFQPRYPRHVAAHSAVVFVMRLTRLNPVGAVSNRAIQDMSRHILLSSSSCGFQPRCSYPPVSRNPVSYAAGPGRRGFQPRYPRRVAANSMSVGGTSLSRFLKKSRRGRALLQEMLHRDAGKPSYTQSRLGVLSLAVIQRLVRKFPDFPPPLHSRRSVV